MTGLNLAHLRAFATVIEQGSFQGAASRLGRTQPAVSQQIRQLEKRVGVRLVERVGRRATPTAAGVALLDHARRIENAVDSALEAVAGYATGVRGRVRLGTGATACIHLLPPVLRDLRRRYPSLEIAVSTGNAADVLDAIDENRLDLGLVTLPAAGRSFAVTPLFDDPFVAIRAVDDVDAADAVTPEALRDLPIVLYEPGALTRRIVDTWFAQAGVVPRVVMELGSIEAIKEMVAAGLGCSILPSMTVRGKGRARGLVVRSPDPPLGRTLGLVVRRDKMLNAALRAACDALTRLPKSPDHEDASAEGASRSP